MGTTYKFSVSRIKYLRQCVCYFYLLLLSNSIK